MIRVQTFIRTLYGTLLFIYSLRTASASWTHSDVIHLTDASPIQGRKLKSDIGLELTEFLGIPYAEPPIGNLRFRKPVAKKPWRTVFNATKQPNSCIQSLDNHFGEFQGATMWNANTPMDEDCLYLNVWVPGTVDPNKKLTVMLWIFGGGFWSGTSTLQVYDGKILSTVENVIIVSFNYRVTLFGFIYAGIPDAPGNAGLWDQLVAMKWVKENIHLFGGDPNQITLFGESAGGASVTMHVLSPHSAPYFKRAITQSGSATAPWSFESRPEALKRLRLLASNRHINCGKITDQPPDMEKIISCLREKPAEVLRENEWITFEFLDFPWTPVVDGDFFTEDPIVSLRRGNFKKSELMVGSNFDESIYFIVYHLGTIFAREKLFTETRFIHDYDTFFEAILKLLPREFKTNPSVRDAIIFEYRDFGVPVSSKQRVNALDKMMGDYHFTCNVNEFAQEYRKARGTTVYSYLFKHRSSVQTWPEWMGVLHGYEINFIFGEPFRNEFNSDLSSARSYTPAEKELSKRFMRYWANFARTGNPNKNPDGSFGPSLWPEYTRDQEYLTLAINDSSVGHGPRMRQCAFWKEYIPKLKTATRDYYKFQKRPTSSAPGVIKWNIISLVWPAFLLTRC